MKNLIKNQMTVAGVILAIMMCVTSQLNAQTWNTNGNSLTPGQFIGTTLGNVEDMRFQLNGSQKMVIKTGTGNVGIGISAPTSNLHLFGTNLLTSASSNGLYHIRNSGSTTTGEDEMKFDADDIQATTDWGANGYNPNDLYLNRLGGNVGVGTGSPTSKLHVSGDMNIQAATAVRPLVVSVGGTTKMLVESNGGTALGYGTSAPPTNGLIVNGNTGIGTSSPSCKLHVSAGAVSASPSSHGALTLATTYTLTGTGPIPLTFIKQMRMDGNVIQTTLTNVLPASGSSLLLNPYGGKIGIGHSSPAARLHVNSSTGERAFQVMVNGTTKMKIESNGGTSIGYLDGVNPPTDGLLVNGNVGIGTGNTPTVYKLEVCGTIRSKEVRVETGWCDYVFADDYKLPPLNEVETFIKEHKHLPEVTAGNIIESEGLEVGKVASQMIKKIEELTLYVIELQKQVDSLKTTK